MNDPVPPSFASSEWHAVIMEVDSDDPLPSSSAPYYKWIKSNTKGRWTFTNKKNVTGLTFRLFLFESGDDAVLFKLTWA